jgi:putative glycosyltransferase (TIGR04372 family)
VPKRVLIAALKRVQRVLGIAPSLWLSILPLIIVTKEWRSFMPRARLGLGRRRARRKPAGPALRFVFVRFSLVYLEQMLEKRKIRHETTKHMVVGILAAAGHHFMSSGRLPLAEHCFDLITKYLPANSWRAIDYLRALAIAQFMQGKVPEAHAAIERVGLAKKFILARGRTATRITNLGNTWFVAIGHVAMIDFLLKQQKLGWGHADAEIVFTHDLTNIAGKSLVEEFVALGMVCKVRGGIGEYYNVKRSNDETDWELLSDDERRMVVHEFWEYEFPGGEVLFYSHAAARIQQRWEAERRQPLLKFSDAQCQMRELLLARMGIPRNAWFVCLHVRESGFHGKWNKIYPSARDANVDDYDLAVSTITERGGWVIRMGDTTMKPMRPRPMVVDYAHSNLKSELTDIVLASSCRFFLGTNSGFATVPGIYGVPCVLTNWVPISLPLWFGRDLMIPKLFWDKKEGRFLTFEEMFASTIGAIQNFYDFPENLEVKDNTPEEINDVVIEMLSATAQGGVKSTCDESLQNRYFATAIAHGSYKGSRIGDSFLRKYEGLLTRSTSYLSDSQNKKTRALIW